MKRLKTVDRYIAVSVPKARVMLKQLRKAIKSAAPKAEEKLSYGMPYYGYHGRLAYFAAFTDHVSYFVMPGKLTTEKYAKQVKRYKTGKATLQFPVGSKIPVALIKQLVKSRMKENEVREIKGFEKSKSGA